MLNWSPKKLWPRPSAPLVLVETGSDVIKRVYRLSDVFPKSEAQLRSIMDGANEIEAERYGKTEGDGYFNLGLNYLF